MVQPLSPPTHEFAHVLERFVSLVSSCSRLRALKTCRVIHEWLCGSYAPACLWHSFFVRSSRRQLPLPVAVRRALRSREMNISSSSVSIFSDHKSWAVYGSNRRLQCIADCRYTPTRRSIPSSNNHLKHTFKCYSYVIIIAHNHKSQQRPSFYSHKWIASDSCDLW